MRKISIALTVGTLALAGIGPFVGGPLDAGKKGGHVVIACGPVAPKPVGVPCPTGRDGCC
jgi:hypothetical protein